LGRLAIAPLPPAPSFLIGQRQKYEGVIIGGRSAYTSSTTKETDVIVNKVLCAAIMLTIPASPALFAGKYKNFKVAVYSRAYEVREMGDPNWLLPRWEEISRQVKVDKIYLETHRDLLIVDEKTLLAAKEFFRSRGIETAGGITYTVDERNRFETFCYTNPEHRKKVREILEYTARHFDEVILDDFFFTSCKCDLCIDAKGRLSWTDYRLKLMDEAGRELIMKAARAVNPKVKVVIKYPNWYEHFQGLGFNLETQPKYFDGVYTGTETRDAVRSNQHLQQYHGYLIFRYFENLTPGGNGGGWVDTGGMTSTDRYAEQLAITMFAKAPEITLFDIRQLQRPIRDTDRAAWQGQGTSYDFDEMMQPIRLANGETARPTTVARTAGHTLERVDTFLDKLGTPVGLKSYKPFHSTGEDFLHNYLGMIGIPMDLVPEFPTEEKIVLLTELAKHDAGIVQKIKGQLRAGKEVVITSGLLKALQGKGIEDIVELVHTDRKAVVREFPAGWTGMVTVEPGIVLPQIGYLTNDSWEETSGLAGPIGYPILHSASYSKGTLYVLAVPDNFADFYRLPVPTITGIKQVLTKDMYVRLDAPGQVALFVYDNGTFIVESFRDETVEITIVTDPRFAQLEDILSGEELKGQKQEAQRGWMGSRPEKVLFQTQVKPHSYRVFRGGEAPAELTQGR
jgi:hypothetical protein